MNINDIKVGMRLKIKDELPGDPLNSEIGYCVGMDKYLGKVYTVCSINGERECVRFVEIKYSWLLSWLEPVPVIDQSSSDELDDINIHSIYYKE